MCFKRKCYCGVRVPYYLPALVNNWPIYLFYNNHQSSPLVKSGNSLHQSCSDDCTWNQEFEPLLCL